MLRKLIAFEPVDSDQLFDLEEELNDYMTLLPRLYDRYSEIEKRGSWATG